jgi:transcriptional regulator with XRE-family HTH domain
MFNTKLMDAVKKLRIKNAPTTISNDLGVSKGSVSSYLKGSIKASGPFLKKFSAHYSIPLSELEEDEFDNEQSAIRKTEIPKLDPHEVADYILLHGDQLRKLAPNFDVWVTNKEVNYLNEYLREKLSKVKTT